MACILSSLSSLILLDQTRKGLVLFSFDRTFSIFQDPPIQKCDQNQKGEKAERNFMVYPVDSKCSQILHLIMLQTIWFHSQTTHVTPVETKWMRPYVIEVVRFIQWDEIDGWIYAKLEYCNCDLMDILRSRSFEVSESETANVMYQVTKTFSYLNLNLTTFWPHKIHTRFTSCTVLMVTFFINNLFLLFLLLYKIKNCHAH